MVIGVIALTDHPAVHAGAWLGTDRYHRAPASPRRSEPRALELQLVAVVGWSKTLAAEVAADGVTVNVVVPGRIATGRVRALDEARAKREGTTVEAAEASSIASIPAALRRPRGVRGRGRDPRRLSGVVYRRRYAARRRWADPLPLEGRCPWWLQPIAQKRSGSGTSPSTRRTWRTSSTTSACPIRASYPGSPVSGDHGPARRLGVHDPPGNDAVPDGCGRSGRCGLRAAHAGDRVRLERARRGRLLLR